MTGVNNDITVEDPAKVHYERTKNAADKFFMWQFGLTLWDAASGESQTYEFDVRPNPKGSYAPDIIFSSRVLEFLRRTNNSDLNKWIYEGVAMVNAQGEEEWRRGIFEKTVPKYQQPLPPEKLPETERNSVLAALQGIESLRVPGDSFEAKELSRRARNSLVAEAAKRFPLAKVTYPEKDSNSAAGAGTAATAAAAAAAPAAGTDDQPPAAPPAPAVVPAEVSANAVVDFPAIFTLITQEDKDENERVEKLRLEETFRNAIGFRQVFHLLAKHRPLMVGHNCFTDLCFFFSNYDAVLPQELTEFKAMVHRVFPLIADTKFLAQKLNFSNTTLSRVFERCSKGENFAQVPCAFELPDWINADNLHNAGYDSFITGYSYAKLRPVVSQQFATRETPALPAFHNVARLFASSYLWTFGSDRDPFEGTMIRISDFSSDVRTIDIETLITPIFAGSPTNLGTKGGAPQVQQTQPSTEQAPRIMISFRWINDTSVILIVDRNGLEFPLSDSDLQDRITEALAPLGATVAAVTMD